MSTITEQYRAVGDVLRDAAVELLPTPERITIGGALGNLLLTFTTEAAVAQWAAHYGADMRSHQFAHEPHRVVVYFAAEAYGLTVQGQASVVAVTPVRSLEVVR